MKALKIIAGIVISLVILVAIVLILVINNLDTLIKEAIERIGSDITQTEVRVNDVNVSLSEGSGAILGFSIANPKGFSDESLLKIGDVGLQLDINSLSKDVVVLKDIHLTGLGLRGELKNIKDTNLEALAKNIQKYLPEEAAAEAQKDSGGGEEGSDIRLMIETLRLGETKLDLVSDKWGSRELTVPGYSQSMIGNKTEGLSPEELGKVILATIVKRAETAVKKEAEKILKEEVEAKVKARLEEEKAKLQAKAEAEKQKLEQQAKEKAKEIENKISDKISEKDKEKLDKLKGLFN